MVQRQNYAETTGAQLADALAGQNDEIRSAAQALHKIENKNAGIIDL